MRFNPFRQTSPEFLSRVDLSIDLFCPFSHEHHDDLVYYGISVFLLHFVDYCHFFEKDNIFYCHFSIME